MKLKERIKTYNFWVSLASAMLLLLNTIGKRFNFSVDENLYNERGFYKNTARHRNGTKYDDFGFDKFGYDENGYDR